MDNNVQDVEDKTIASYYVPAGNCRLIFEDDTFWTTQRIMGNLFDVETNTITYHLQEIFRSGELEEDSVTRIFRVTAADGKKYNTNFYNLDTIISVGYRVKSASATKFRQWATETLRNYVMHNLSKREGFRDLTEDQKRIAIRQEMIEHNKSLAEAAKMAGMADKLSKN